MRIIASISALLALASIAESRKIHFINKCQQKVWVGAQGNSNHKEPEQGGWLLTESNTGPTKTIDVEENWSGRFWGRTGCNFDAQGLGQCESGHCGTGLHCKGLGGVTPATLAQMTLSGNDAQDLYNLSLVDGFNLPMAIEPSDKVCGTTKCEKHMNASCPPELQKKHGENVVGCLSACEKFRTEEYCCTGALNTPQTCGPTNFSKVFKDACPQAHSFAFDNEGTSFTCKTESKPEYTIVFCP